jgi:hypothetical protein
MQRSWCFRNRPKSFPVPKTRLRAGCPFHPEGLRTAELGTEQSSRGLRTSDERRLQHYESDVSVVDVEVDAGTPHNTNGVKVIVSARPSGPVTIALACHVVSLNGSDSLRATFLWAPVADAVTRAPPLKCTLPAGSMVFAVITVLTCGSGAETICVARGTDVWAGPAVPFLLSEPCGV